MIRTPRLGTAFRAGEAFGQVVDGLEHQFAGDVSLILGNNLLAEVLFKILADDKDQFAEAGAQGVIDGIVHDGLTVGTQSVELLQPAVAAAHTGSQQKKSRFHVVMY